MESLEAYLTRIRSVLAHVTIDKPAGRYLDLATSGQSINPEELSAPTVPEEQLALFQEAVLEQVARCNTDKTKIGINELLKHLLLTIAPEMEHFTAERYLYRLRIIFKRCLMPDFPFPEEIWNYMCDCLKSAGSFLIEQGYFTASREVIDSLAGMGRIAALKGLPTANTQSSLRILENKALEKNQTPLALAAKNARFNLET